MQIYSPNQHRATTIQKYHTDNAHGNCIQNAVRVRVKRANGEKGRTTDRNETQRHIQARLSGERMLNVSRQMERTMRYDERNG